MSNLGIGVMLGILGGNRETVESMQKAINRTIENITFDESCIKLYFSDGKLTLFDDGQSCCESRYMRTDDNPIEFIGGVFTGAEIKDAPNETKDEDWGVHDVQFLEIKTDKGSFVMSSHNEHNGYYGGFLIKAEWTAL